MDPAAPDVDAAHAGPQVVIKARSGRATGVALVLLALGILALSTLHGGLSEGVWALPVVLMLLAVAWTVFFSPHLRLNLDGITLTRSVSVTSLPWQSFADAEARWGLRMTDTSAKSVTWTGISGRPGAPENEPGVVGRMAEGAGAGSARRRHIAAVDGASRTTSVRHRDAERTRSIHDLPMSQLTDPQSRERRSMMLTAAQAAIVLELYAEHRTSPAEGAHGSAPGGFRSRPRWSAISAMLIPALAVAFLSF